MIANNQFRARIIWSGDSPLYAGRRYTFNGAEVSDVQVSRVRYKTDPQTSLRLPGSHLVRGDHGEVDLAFPASFTASLVDTSSAACAFVLRDSLTGAEVGRGALLYPLRRSSNVQWQEESINPGKRAAIKGQKPTILWLTGLSGSGKSTIANALEFRLHSRGHHSMLLDGDNVRHGLNKDLGFTLGDRVENIRRIGEVASLMADAGLLVIAAFISPFRSDRATARALVPRGNFIEIYLSTPLAECERRDPKGLYQKARSGQIPNFTGIDSPYEAPESPEMVLDTSVVSANECVRAILDYLEANARLA